MNGRAPVRRVGSLGSTYLVSIHMIASLECDVKSLALYPTGFCSERQCVYYTCNFPLFIGYFTLHFQAVVVLKRKDKRFAAFWITLRVTYYLFFALDSTNRLLTLHIVILQYETKERRNYWTAIFPRLRSSQAPCLFPVSSFE